MHLRPTSYPPRSQRQGLDPHDRWLDVAPESNDADDNTQDIYNIVSIGCDMADATAVAALMPFVLKRAGKGLRDERTLEELSFGRRGGRNTGSGCEQVNCLEDEEARKCAAEIGYAVGMLAICRHNLE